MKKAAIFDLDGTLIDSVGAIGRSMNSTLEQFGYPVHPIELYQQKLVGWGSDYLMRHALPEGIDEETFKKVKVVFWEIYGNECKKKPIIFPGVPEMLTKLRNGGMATAILTNKPDHMTQYIMEAGLGDYIDFALGQKIGAPTKPDPSLLPYIGEKLGALPFAYVGDSEVDMKVGSQHGVYTVGVTWGTRTGEFLKENGADDTADTAEELAALILARK